MKLSIILLTANPTEKQYAWREAIDSYKRVADQVIVINGGEEKLNIDNITEVFKPDPEVWDWSEHAKNLNLALDLADGDWIIKTDIDWVFDERTKDKLREKLSYCQSPVATMQKKTFYPKERYIQKGEIPMIINGENKKKIRFGKDMNKYTDLTYPIFAGDEVDKKGVPLGEFIGEIAWYKTGVDFWNFDYTFSTIENMRKKWLRMSKSHKEYFGATEWGETEEEAQEAFLRNMRGKMERSLRIKDINVLPPAIRQRILDLKPEEFGKAFWGMI